MLAPIGLSLVLVPQTRLHPHSAASSGRSGGLSMRGPPPEIARQLAPDPNDPRSKAEGGWTKSDVNQMWSAFETVYGSRERAEAAANRNVKVLLPFLNSPETIRGSYAVLVDMLGKEEASEIIVKNPGVLSCAPEDLAKTKPGDIRLPRCTPTSSIFGTLRPLSGPWHARSRANTRCIPVSSRASTGASPEAAARIERRKPRCRWKRFGSGSKHRLMHVHWA